MNSRLWTRAVGLTASSASAVSLIRQAVSSSKSSGQHDAASFGDRALKGFSCGSCHFLDSSLACSPGDVATSLPERPCFRCGMFSLATIVWICSRSGSNNLIAQNTPQTSFPNALIRQVIKWFFGNACVRQNALSPASPYFWRTFNACRSVQISSDILICFWQIA